MTVTGGQLPATGKVTAAKQLAGVTGLRLHAQRVDDAAAR